MAKRRQFSRRGFQVMKNSAFTNEQILSWMQYFGTQTAIDLERIKIVDMSREDKNLLPAIHNFRTVLAFLDAGQNGIFYKLWDAGLGDCDVWLGEGLTPDGKPIRPCKLPGVLRHDLTGPAAVLIQNPAARNTARIGLKNDNFSLGSVRYVGSEIRSVIMSMLHVDIQDTICIISGESIAVESAIMASAGKIIAVEYREADRALMESNCDKFGLNNVAIVENARPETLSGLPVPTLSFIVATGRLESEIQDLLAVNPRMQFVVYTLELDILAKIPALFEKYGIHDTEITQIAVSKLDADNRFRPQPSPWLIAGAV